MSDRVGLTCNEAIIFFVCNKQAIYSCGSTFIHVYYRTKEICKIVLLCIVYSIKHLCLHTFQLHAEDTEYLYLIQGSIFKEQVIPSKLIKS